MDYSDLSNVEIKIEVFKRRGYSVRQIEGGYAFHVASPYTYVGDPYPTELEAWEHGMFIELVETGGMQEIGLELIEPMEYRIDNHPKNVERPKHAVTIYGERQYFNASNDDLWRAVCEAWLMCTHEQRIQGSMEVALTKAIKEHYAK